MHFFIDLSQLTAQSLTGNPYGPVSNDLTNKFNITSQFQLISQTKAFACQDSLLIVQQSSTNASLVNIILKPIKGLKIPFRPVKYFIYRGLLKSSFISGSAIIPPSPSNSEFIANFWTNWSIFKTNINQPTLIDPTPASFGYDTTLPPTLAIEKIFDNSQTDARAAIVREGDWIGDFGTIDKIGFEIILSNDSFLLDLEYLESNEFQIEVSAFTGFELRAKREQILSFIDPAAFFGLHYESGVNISVFSGNTKNVSILKRNDIYSLLLNKFKTKNRVYLDIRSEKGYSYNFYENYDDGSTNNIKIGNSTFTPAAQNYSTHEWPIIFIDIPITTTKNENDIKINLRIDDNTKPILFLENTEILEGNRNAKFLGENEILNGTAIDWSKDLTFKFPNTGTNNKENIAFYLKLQYFRQIHNVNTIPTTLGLQTQSTFKSVFASLDTKNLGDTDQKFWQVSNEHFSFIQGALPDGNSFSGVAVQEANFDTNRIILHTQMLFPRKTTGYSYLRTDAEINEGFSLEGNSNQMSFLRKDIYSYSQSIQENSTYPPYQAFGHCSMERFYR